MEAEKKEERGNSEAASSASSSPSHEFSFTISLHSSSSAATTAAITTPETIKQQQHQQQSPSAIDLTPADEIFFHGHLLPLHFLSHLHAASSSSPRHSANSMDSFTLPIRDMLREETPPTDIHDHAGGGRGGNAECPRGRKVPFSLFKWRRGPASESKESQQQEKRKARFDVSQFVKRYVKMVKPLLSPKGGGGGGGWGRRESVGFRRQTYSFSGAVSPRERRDVRGRRGEFSAPASMRTSPTNSGLLLATAGVPSPSSDSTMEELQAAIQAAIAHCKNSIAAHDQKDTSPDLSVPVT